MRWRDMLDDDLPHLWNVANVVHVDYAETPAVFAACFRLYPSGCRILESDVGEVAGYLISHPGRQDRPPVLDTPLTSLAEPFDCYFLHDLALSPVARGTGSARNAVQIVVDEARACRLPRVVLIAVGDAHGFWEKQGFQLLGDGLVAPTKGYGPEARMYQRYV